MTRHRDPRWSNVINAHRARRLFRKLKSWRRVGQRLADEQGRRMPYLAPSVRNAVRDYDNGKRDFIPGMGAE